MEFTDYFDLKELCIFGPGNKYLPDCSLLVIIKKSGIPSNEDYRELMYPISYLSSTKTTITTHPLPPLYPSNKVQGSFFVKSQEFGRLECFHQRGLSDK